LHAVGLPAPADAQDVATYDAIFTGSWSTTSTPGGVVSGAHFTTLIGAVHGSGVTFWRAGGFASSGVEQVAELGAVSGFISEYNAVVSAHRRALVNQAGTGATGSSSFQIDLSATHPLLTLLSMIGPSPDWFVGVSGLSLKDSEGQWRPRVEVNLYPYDAGTEDGSDFSLSNEATNPQQPIRSIRGEGRFSTAAMARLTLVLKSALPQPPPPPEPPAACQSLIAPYWHGAGGFVARPSDGRSANVRVRCGGASYENREYAGDDGLIVRLIPDGRCMSQDGRPLLGEVTFEGVEPGGWYWVNGDRNVALAPLACEESLTSDLRPPVPDGVMARPSGDARFVRSVTGRLYGTFMHHASSGFVGIVPHLVDLEGAGEHVAPFWKGEGGVVGWPLDGRSAIFRQSCGEGPPELFVLEAGEDGLIVALLPGCFADDGARTVGQLEVDGIEDGAWYWLSNGRYVAVAPFVARGTDRSGFPVPLVPGGLDSVEEGPLGTLFVQGRRMGIVPRIAEP
jgi:hypothetical protein